MFYSAIRTLTHVRYVSELKKNLMPLIILDSKGYRYTAKGRVLKISRVCSCRHEWTYKLRTVVHFAGFYSYRG